VAASSVDRDVKPVRAVEAHAARICAIAIALAVVGAFGTWRVVGAVSLDGFDGPHNGWLVVIFALVALAGVRPLSRGSWFGIVTVVGCAGVMVFTAVESVVDDAAVLGGRSGWGVWLTTVASVLLGAVGATVAAGRLGDRC
jgi:CDP-diglyceride synthetase